MMSPASRFASERSAGSAEVGDRPPGVLGVGVAGSDLEEALEVRDRAFPVPASPLAIARGLARPPAVAPGGREARVELDRPPEVGDRAREVALRVARIPAEAPGPGVARRDLDRPSRVRDGALQIAPRHARA